jgi:DNA repair ATPase RecN
MTGQEALDAAAGERARRALERVRESEGGLAALREEVEDLQVRLERALFENRRLAETLAVKERLLNDALLRSQRLEGMVLQLRASPSAGTDAGVAPAADSRLRAAARAVKRALGV